MDAEPITAKRWRTGPEYFPRDQWLRDWGMEIAERIPGKPALWREGKHGEPMTEEEAEAHIQRMAEKLSRKHG